MEKRLFSLLLAIIIITIIFCTGCSSKKSNSDNNQIAYISSNTDSEYLKTFKDLQLGILFDFNLKLPNADKSWVNIWVEGYSNGKAVEPFHLAELSYGLSPNKVEEGPMGFGILNANSIEPQFFLYSKGVKTTPDIKDKSFFIKSAASIWQYAIGSEPIGLESGKETILAVYRQGKNSLRAGYDYQNLNSINQMIKDDITVLILKIKVEKKDK